MLECLLLRACLLHRMAHSSWFWPSNTDLQIYPIIQDIILPTFLLQNFICLRIPSVFMKLLYLGTISHPQRAPGKIIANRILSEEPGMKSVG